MKKTIFLLAVVFMASFSFLSAQNLVFQNQEPSAAGTGKCEPREETRADYTLKYITGNPTNALGTSAYTGTRYTSGCIHFTQQQMYNYVGATLHQINVGVAQQSSMNNITDYKIWIKTAMDGPIVYEQTITNTQLNLPASGYAWRNFTLTTPYTITNSALVIGFTATVTSTASANFYPLAMSEAANDTYKPGGFNFINVSTDPNAHKAGAIWNTIATYGNLAIEGLLTNAPNLPVNDLAAAYTLSPSIKWVGSPAAFTVTVYNTGTAPQNNYSVQLLNSYDQVLGSTTVTTALAPGASAIINVSYTPTSAANLVVKGRVTLTGDEVLQNNVTDLITCKVYAYRPMAYCDFRGVSGVGAGAAVSHQAAIEYNATDLIPFGGRQLKAIEVAFGVPANTLGVCTVWVRSSLTGANLVQKTFTPVDGWNIVTLDAPFILPATPVYVGWSGQSSVNYIIGMVNNPPIVSKGTHIQYSTAAWQTYTQHNAIIGVVEPAPGMVNIATAINPAKSGTVTGAGGYAIGSPVTLTATPKLGFAFMNWTNGTTVLSTSNPYIFNASEDATITANFTPIGGIICDDDVVIGNGTTTFNHVPISTWEHSYTQQIYLASEIGYPDGGAITKISFKWNIANTQNKTNQKIFMGNTTKNAFASTTDWVTLANLTQVFQGTIALNNTGPSNYVTIELDDSFEYTGGNLVVAFLNADGNSAQYTSLMPYQVTAGAGRALYAYSMSTVYNPGAPPTGTLYNNFPNIKFEVCVGAPGGVIQGTASCQGIPTPGVLIEINELPDMFTITDAAGEYKFDLVPVGNYSLTATKFAYFDGYEEPFEVAVDQVYTKNFEICALPLYSVYGVVKAADGTLIQNAELKLTGYETFTTKSKVYGEYEFANVYAPKEYTLTITAKGYQPHTQTVNVTAPVNLGTIILYEIPFPPTNVVAVNIDPYAEISWNAPEPDKGSDRGVVGYKLWRLQPGQENDPTVWTTLTATPVNAYVYTDATWATAEKGAYKWAVITCYHGDIESEVEFSNELIKSVKVNYAINITTNSGDSPFGAKVKLKNAQYENELISNATGVTFTNIYSGTYCLAIMLTGFHPYDAIVDVPEEGGSHDAVLIKIGTDIQEYVSNCNIYPNPTMDKLFVERVTKTQAKIEIYNAMGMFINKYETEETTFEINVSMLPAGTYFIRVAEGGYTNVKSFVKK